MFIFHFNFIEFNNREMLKVFTAVSETTAYCHHTGMTQNASKRQKIQAGAFDISISLFQLLIFDDEFISVDH